MVAWWYSKANKIWLRVLALVVSSVFFFTQVVGASVPDRSFWRERRKVRQELLASREKPRQSDRWSSEALLRGKKLEEKDVAGEVSSLITPQNLFTVPSQYGTVKEIHTQGSGKKPQGMGNRLIIHIQDAHSSPEAQLNSANILKYLQRGVAKDSTLPLLICVEGSSGLVDTTLLSSFPEKKIKEEVASEFLKEGKITGEEYFAITGGEKAPAVNIYIYGVEDKRAYEKNLKAFDEGIASGESLRNYLREVQEEMKPLKARLYNKRLKDLESKIEVYQKKKISLTEYCQSLYGVLNGNVAAERSSAKRSKADALPLQAKYPNFKLFVEASKFEKKIDFSKVDSERSKYIKELSSKLTNDELSDLLIMSLDYRLGKVTSAEYYTYLQSLSSRMGKGMRSSDPRILTELVTSKEGKNEYPNLNLYIKYNKLYDRINQNRLFSEISELEQEVKERLCEREEERELVKLSRMLGVLQDLVSLKISNEDLAYYYKHRNEISESRGLSHFFENVAVPINRDDSSATGVVAGFSLREGGNGRKLKLATTGISPANLSKFEEFYRIALKRNQALVDNTVSRMEKEGVKVAVLIAGGFHTPGITELLREKNTSYVVVTPRLGEDYSSDLEISPRKKKTDLEKAIAGIIGALRATTLLGDKSFRTCLVIHLYGRTLIFYSQFPPSELKEAFAELKNWEDETGAREVIKDVEFLPEVLSRGKEAFVLGVARGRNNSVLPFVFQYNIARKKFEVIYGEEKCEGFISSGSFDNTREIGSVASGRLGELWPFLAKDVAVPEGVDSRKAVSMEQTPQKVHRLPIMYSIRVFSNAAFGNIGERLHRVKGGLNYVIKKLFDEKKDVTEEFTGERKVSNIKRGVSLFFLDGLQYEDFTLRQKITLLRRGIWSKKRFDRKKKDLIEHLHIFYLDSGKNLFWVKGKYAAAHYGVGLKSVYISAGFVRRADYFGLKEVGCHEALQILGLSHRQALRMTLNKGIPNVAKKLMDKLAEQDRQIGSILSSSMPGNNAKEPQSTKQQKVHDGQFRTGVWGIKLPGLVAKIQQFTSGKKPEEMSVLDLGPGAGFEGPLDLATKNVDSSETALDTFLKGLNINKKSISKEKDLVDFLKGASEETYDIVHAHLSLQYFDDKTRRFIFRRILEVLKPGGVFALSMAVSTGGTHEGEIRGFDSENYLRDVLKEVLPGKFDIRVLGKEKLEKGGEHLVAVAMKPRTWPDVIKPGLGEEGEVTGFLYSPYGLRDFLLRLGPDFAKWWIHHFLKAERARNWMKEDKLPDTVSAKEIKKWHGQRHQFELFKESLPEDFVSELERYGYRYRKEDGVFSLVKNLHVTAVFGAHDIKPIEDVGVIKEPLISIPDVRDPAIFTPHMGRGQASYYSEDVAEREGLSDARSVIKYLQAYNRLIKEPTVENFFNATINPNTNTGPYFTTMVYLLNQGVSKEFLTLLHVGFYLHRTIFGKDCRYGQYALSNCKAEDLLMFQRILEKFCQDNYPEDNLQQERKENVTFGSIGEKLHRIAAGLNDLIAGLFKSNKNISRKFTGDKSRSAIRRKVFKFLNSLEYKSLSRTQKEKLRKSGIKDEEEFNKKKSDIKKRLSVIYLDSGKNLFWVKGKYGAAHYGKKRRNVYVSAGYATRASPDQIYEVVTHDVLHILGLSHQQALNVAKKHNISYRAQELMDKLAKEDKEQDAGTFFCRLLDPGNLLMRGIKGKKAVEYRAKIKPRRKSEEVRNFLKEVGGITFEGPLRGLDFGSSQDLQALKELLTPREAKKLSEIAATTIFSSKFRGKIRVEALDDEEKDKIVYVARIHGLTEEKPRVFTEEIKLVENKLTGKWETPKGQADAIGYILWSLFGLKDIKVTYDLYYPGDARRGIERIPQVGGMGTSGNTNTGLFMIGSVLSGADLSIGDILALAAIAENEYFKGYTGAQEGVSSVLGGAQKVTWQGGIKDKDGNLKNHPFSGLAIPVCKSEEDFRFIEDRVVLVQPGVRYAKVESDIKKMAHRSASCINTMWMQEARVERDKTTGKDIPVDPVGAGYHRNKIKHGNKQVQGVIEKDIGLINEGNIGYVKERDSLCLRNMQLILYGDDDLGIDPKREWLDEHSISDRIGIATYVPRSKWTGLLTQEKAAEIEEELEPILKKEERKEKISKKEQEKVNDYALENFTRLYNNKISLYSDYAREISNAVKRVNEEKGEAYMSAIELGAGGDGGIVALFSKGGKKHLREFLKELGLSDLTKDPAEIEEIVTKTGGTLQGWMPYEISREGFKLWFDKMDPEEAKKEDYIIPELPQPVSYSENTGRYSPVVPKSHRTSFLRRKGRGRTLLFNELIEGMRHIFQQLRKLISSLWGKKKPTAILSVEDLRCITEAIEGKKVHTYVTTRGILSKDEKLLTECASLEDLVFIVMRAARADYKNLTEPMNAKQILEYIENVQVWEGRDSIKEDESDYFGALGIIRDLVDKCETVSEARGYLAGSDLHKGDAYEIASTTLDNFAPGMGFVPMQEVVRRIEEQHVRDLASFGVSIAVSLGGTKIGSGAVNPAGDIFARVPDIKTPVDSDEVLFEAICSQIETVARKVGPEKVVKIGVSSPGPLNPETGVIIETENIPLKDFYLKTRVEMFFLNTFDRAIDAKVFHDADARAKGETSAKGTLPGCQNMMFLNWGTGIGNGVIHDGKVYWNDPVVGTMIGEIGHTVIRTEDGKYRHDHSMKDRYPSPDELAEGEMDIELYLGGPALIQRIRKQILECSEGPQLLATVDKTAENLELVDINKAAREGNELAIELIEKAGVELGRGLAAFIKYWKLERKEEFTFTDNVVLGAGVAKIGNGVTRKDATDGEKPVLSEAVKEGLRRELGSKVSDSINVVMSKLVMTEFDYDGELLTFQPELKDFLASKATDKESSINSPPDDALSMKLLMERYRRLSGNLRATSTHKGGDYNRTRMIVTTVWTAYQAEQEEKELKETFIEKFRDTLVKELKQAQEEEPEAIDKAFETLQKIGMDKNNPENSIANGLCKMVQLASRGGGNYDKVELTTSGRSKYHLLRKYHTLALRVLTDRLNEKVYSEKAIQLADLVLEAYCSDEATERDAEAAQENKKEQQIQKLLIFLQKVNRQHIKKAQQVLKDEIFLEVYTEEENSIIDQCWKMLNLALKGKDPAQALLRVKNFERLQGERRSGRGDKKANAVYIIAQEFLNDPGMLSYLIEEMEKPSFKGPIEDANKPRLYLQLRRLKCILDMTGVKNKLPKKFPKRNEIGGLSTLQKAFETITKMAMAQLARKVDSEGRGIKEGTIDELVELAKGDNPMAVYLILEKYVGALQDFTSDERVEAFRKIAETEVYTELVKLILNLIERSLEERTSSERQEIRGVWEKIATGPTLGLLEKVFERDEELTNLAKRFEQMNSPYPANNVDVETEIKELTDEIRRLAKSNKRGVYLLLEMAYSGTLPDIRVAAIEALGEKGIATPLVIAVLEEISKPEGAWPEKEQQAARKALENFDDKAFTPLAEIFKAPEGTTPTPDEDKPRTFVDDVLFLIEHFGKENVVVLSDESGNAQVAVVADLQGRVMTSSFDGTDGLSLGYINREVIKNMVQGNKANPHINVAGGEDRFWIGPEGCQFDLGHWFTPALIDTEPFEIIGQRKDSVSFQKRAELPKYSGTDFDIEIGRTVRVLSREGLRRILELKDLPKDLKVVAFASHNKITNMERKAGSKDKGLISIWILGMFNPSPETTVVIPFNEGPESELGPVVNDAYFGKVPDNKLVVKKNVLFFSGDGTHRSKIGLSPERAKPILGSYDAKNKVLTIVQFTKPEDAVDYVNSMWEENPYAGDVVNSYNDGPVEPGGKPLGPFYGLETSSPARELKPFESVSHTHRTIHFQGSEKALDRIARDTLGVSLKEIKNAFRSKGSILEAAKLLIELREEGTTELKTGEFVKQRKFSRRTVNYEISGLRLLGLIDSDRGIVRLAEEYRDITEEDLVKMNEAAQEIIGKEGLDRWRLNGIRAKDISAIKEKLANIVRERKILSAAKSFLDGSDPDMSINNLRTLLARVYDSETLRRIIKGASDYAVHLQSESNWSHVGVRTDEITLEDIGRAGKDNKAIQNKLAEVISALTDRIRELRGHKAQSPASPQESAQTTGSLTTPLASLRSFVYVIVAVILGWASTGVAKEIIRNITIQGRIMAESGNNTPVLSIIFVLGMAFLAGMVVSYRFKRLEQKDKMMGRTGIDRFLLNFGASLIVGVIVGHILIFLTSLASSLPVAQAALLMVQLIFLSLIACIAGYISNSSIINWQWKRQEGQIETKPSPEAVVDESSADRSPDVLNIDAYLKELDDDDSSACLELKVLYDNEWELRRERLVGALELYQETYPDVTEVVIARAPGRVTLNEHTDYNDAVSLGIPTIKDNIAIVGINRENRLILDNMDENFKAKSFAISEIEEMSISVTKNKQEMEWTDFALALYQALIPRLQGYGATVPGLSVLIDGSEEYGYGGVPIESNISSSAAFEVSQIYAVEALLGIRGQMTGGEVIEIGREAEAKIGFPCGKLDQGSSTVGRVPVLPGQMVGAAIDCVPRLDDKGKDKTVIEPFEVPSILEAILVYTGPQGEVEKDKRVIEGELGSWILAQKFMDEATPSGSAWLDPQAVRKSNFGDIKPDHNGRPHLYDDNRAYPVFLKPAFFSRTFLKDLGVEVSEDELTEWVKENLPTAVTKKELIKKYKMPEEFFNEVTKNARGIVDVENITYNLQGTVLHAIGEQDRAEEIMQALKDAATTAGEEQAAALERFGRLQKAGYESLRDNYRNSTPNIDAIANWAMEQPWCLAPRHFGAGWGGWMQIWIKPGMYNKAEVSLKKFLKRQKWYKNVAKSNGLKVKKQLERDIMPFKPGAPASVLGTNTKALTSSVRDVSPRSKGPSTKLLPLLFGGLIISLVMNSNVFGAVREIIKSGQQAGLESSFGFPFGLGLLGLLTCAVAVIGVSAMYRKVSLAGAGVVGVEQVGLFELLGLEGRAWNVAPTRVWQALKSLFEGGRGFVAAIFRKPSKRAQLRMSWLGPRGISPERIAEITERARRLLVEKGINQENQEINSLLGWTSLPKQMAVETEGIEKLATMVGRRFETVVVMGEKARLYAEVAAAIVGREGYPEVLVLEPTSPEEVWKIERKIDLEKTLFVTSSLEPACQYFYEKLIGLLEGKGIPAEKIASQAGRQFVAITETNTLLSKEARKREFQRTFNVPEGMISGSSAIFGEGGLFMLALAGVDIKGFVESGIKGMEICGEENAEKNLAVRLAAFLQGAMRQAGGQIVLVLPEGLEGLGKVWQGVISPLGEEGNRIISITEEELAKRRFGKETAFIRLNVGREKKSLAIEELREAGHPVLEIGLRGTEAIGTLLYVGVFARLLSYLMGMEGFGEPAGLETSLPARAIAGSGLEEMPTSEAMGTKITEILPLFKHLVGQEAPKHKKTNVSVIHLESALNIETESEATALGMGIKFRVTPKGNELFKFMGEIVEAAEQAGNTDRVRFAFVSNTENLSKEVIAKMLRDFMVKNGVKPEFAGNVLKDGLIIDRETERIVDLSGKISAARVCSVITEKLLGTAGGNGIKINIITSDENAWRKDIDERMMKQVLWMVLEPAGPGEVLSTAESLVIAVEGRKLSRWLEDWIRSRYTADEADWVLSEIMRGKGQIILPARAVDENYLEGIKEQEKVYKVQA